ncbi:NAD(P)H-binding protein [Kibdelosporangium persicum]|uniref:Nucleoside-diphosphate sugar epimerase n=1 Tax=Kibdelosporangium persicum TaxID=2698649 RepID=A0ABX2FEG4_9PSEU|nr:NAD(P)H-binding protein [Kibdelosporangium persicum]NRN69776.1 Nucleoside-diphosphate sugar epimerase [Kibdelosporangium persicum]
MTLLLTGANGQLGTLIKKHLTERGAAFVVGSRTPSPDGRVVDFADPAGMEQAFAGVTTLILISTSGGDRVTLHGNAVTAAKKAGVRHIIYTSVTDAPTSPLALAADHKATEEAIVDSGIAYTFLRNNMYHENYTGQLAHADGTFLTSAGSGLLASAARDDFALAAAVVATTPGHENTAYELTGSTAWTFDTFAELVAEISGEPFVHKSIPAEDLRAGYIAAGLPPEAADLYTDIHVHIERGALAEVRPDLEKLIGRPATPVADAIRAALGK